jgi:hypothetical protein
MDKRWYRRYRVAPLLLLGGIIGTACTVLLAKDHGNLSAVPAAPAATASASATMPLIHNERVRQLISMGEAFASPARWQAREFPGNSPFAASFAAQKEYEVLTHVAPAPGASSYRFHF